MNPWKGEAGAGRGWRGWGLGVEGGVGEEGGGRRRRGTGDRETVKEWEREKDRYRGGQGEQDGGLAA